MSSKKTEETLPPEDLASQLPNKLVYLAGPMEFTNDDGLGWRLEYKEELAKLNIECILPNEEEEDVKGETEMRQIKETDLERYIELMRKFIEMDLHFVENVDMVIARWEGEKMSGTIGEAQHAYLKGIPFYLVTSQPIEEIPGWFLACCTEVFESLSCLLLFLTKKSFYK